LTILSSLPSYLFPYPPFSFSINRERKRERVRERQMKMRSIHNSRDRGDEIEADMIDTADYYIHRHTI